LYYQEEVMKIGLVIMLAESRELGRAPTYREIHTMAIHAEESGFDSIWLYDHLLYRPEGVPTIGIWECWTMLSALAEATRRIELGTLVLCNSFRNPAILAKMATTLDEVSQGRFILGLGAGWNQPEYEAFGLPFDHRVDRFEEALKIICPLVREGRVDFEGKYYQANNCEITPRGPSPKGPLILVGAEGPRMLRLTAQYADLWNMSYMGKPSSFEPHRSKMLEACCAVGRDPATLGMTALIALANPDLGEPFPLGVEPLSGSDEEIVEAMQGYALLGTAHLLFYLTPYMPEAVDRLVRVMRLYRSANP
jgi:alkanesulfonate monooxygenase SsuD/methylene tetrahydromethanopterin reductase-like flavin-dependent oxidoreductase (luciferase family)